MRTWLALCVCGLGALSAGCELAPIAARNLVYESALRTDEACTCARNRKLADDAWNQARRAAPGQAYSKDYVKGFKAGYADDLDTGGCGLPPPLPARCYWFKHY